MGPKLHCRTTNLDILDIALAEENVDHYNRLVDSINKLQSVKKKKVIFLARLGTNYKGSKLVKVIDIISKIKSESVQFSDKEY